MFIEYHLLAVGVSGSTPDGITNKLKIKEL